MIPWEYVVGGGITVCGSLFAFFNARMTAIDDERREREEREEVAQRMDHSNDEQRAA